ncbi:4388_t:CDS:1, partial [Ambispora gerdemannii]
VLKSVPPPLTVSPYTDTLNKNQQISYRYGNAYHSIGISIENDYYDPQVQHLRNELRAEIHAIANDIGKLKLYLSQYYLQGVIPQNE